MDKYVMEIHNVSNIIGWMQNRLITESKTTFNYEKGNDVAIVERKSQLVQLYDSKGNLEDYLSKGNQVDNKA